MRTSASLFAAIAITASAGAWGTGTGWSSGAIPPIQGPMSTHPPNLHGPTPGFGYAYPPHLFPYNAPGPGSRAPGARPSGPADNTPVSRELVEQRRQAAIRRMEEIRRGQIRTHRDALYNFYFGHRPGY